MVNDQPDGVIVITPAEVYAEVKVLTDNVRTLLAQDNADRAERSAAQQLAADHEVRIRRLERALWIGVGAAAAIGSAVGTAASTLVSAATP